MSVEGSPTSALGLSAECGDATRPSGHARGASSPGATPSCASPRLTREERREVARRISSRAICAWLSAITAASPDVGISEDFVGLLDQLPFPVGLVDLQGCRILAASAAMRALLDGTDAGSSGHLVLGANRAVMLQLCELLRSSAIDAFEARQHVLTGDGRRLDLDLWASCSPGSGRRHAVVLLAPDDVRAKADHAPDGVDSCADRATESAMGVFDAHWRIEHVSVNAAALFGRAPGDLVGSSLLEAVHPKDRANLIATLSHAALDDTGAEIGLRLPCAGGSWKEAWLTVAPLADHDLRFAFVARVSPTARTDAHQRVALLERSMWRIARTLEDAGVVARIDRIPDVGKLPGLADVSGRQWEVLTRLLRGERVPGIAEALYVSQSTVRNQLARVYRKLGVRSQAELLALLRCDDDPKAP